jgi:hypothetical protein
MCAHRRGTDHFILLLRDAIPTNAERCIRRTATFERLRFTARGENRTRRELQVVDALIATAGRSLGAAVTLVIRATVSVPIRRGCTGDLLIECLGCTSPTRAARCSVCAAFVGWALLVKDSSCSCNRNLGFVAVGPGGSDLEAASYARADMHHVPQWQLQTLNVLWRGKQV